MTLGRPRFFPSVGLCVLCLGCARHAPLDSLGLAARSAGAEAVEDRATPDGGVLINGHVEGRAFSLRIPARWNGEAVLYAKPYSTPGSSLGISADPVKDDPSLGVLPRAYAEGYAVGEPAYDKSGVAIQSGTHSLVRLSTLVRRIGARKVYVVGGSMGGGVVESALETAPSAFDGGVALCGVVDDWVNEVGYLIDIRAAYNYFTRSTRYALPGNPDLSRSGLPSALPKALSFAIPVYQIVQIKRLLHPVAALFAAASKHPRGPEAQMIRNISAASGAPPELASFLYPLVTISLGMDDIRATYGGSIYGNEDKVYSSPQLSPDGNLALNAGIQRVAADPKAVANAIAWHRATGRFTAPLVTLHSEWDSLVPYSQETRLRSVVEATDNLRNLRQFTVPTAMQAIPGTSLHGVAHCGFTSAQVADAWESLRRWTSAPAG
jgi:pimeloyl-ACP methyl ester carboxylesterase